MLSSFKRLLVLVIIRGVLSNEFSFLDRAQWARSFFHRLAIRAVSN